MSTNNDQFMTRDEIETFPLWDGMKGGIGYYDPRYGKHRKVDPDTWWASILAQHLHLDPYGDVRLQVDGGKTYLVPLCSVPQRCQDHLGKKIAFSVAVMLNGQTQHHIDYPLLRVIDLDCVGVATDEQFLIVSRMFPTAYLIRSNGIQIFLMPSELPWQSEAELLAAMGIKAAAATGLEYDAHHLLKTGAAAASQHHLYRTPWGYARRVGREIWCFAPWGNVSTVREAAVDLGISMPVTAPVSAIAQSGCSALHVPMSFAPRLAVLPASSACARVSEGPKTAEFSAIMAYRRSLLLCGTSVEAAYEAILSHNWQEHDASAIRRTVAYIRVHPKYAPDAVWHGTAPAGAAPMSPELIEGIARDQEITQLRLGPMFSLRWLMQRTKKPYADRAWSLKFLHPYAESYSLTDDDAVHIFMTWEEFADVRKRSLDTIGPVRTEEDIRRCWKTFLNYVPRPVHPTVATAVRGAILRLTQANVSAGKRAEFTTTELRSQQPLLSLRHAQRVLALLATEGFLEKVSSGKWTKWRMSTRHTLDETQAGSEGEGGRADVMVAGPVAMAPPVNESQARENKSEEVASASATTAPNGLARPMEPWKLTILSIIDQKIKTKKEYERRIMAEFEAKEGRRKAAARKKAGLAFKRRGQRYIEERDRLIDEGYSPSEASQIAREVIPPVPRAPRKQRAQPAPSSSFPVGR